jgi:hypothetical protein
VYYALPEREWLVTSSGRELEEYSRGRTVQHYREDSGFPEYSPRTFFARLNDAARASVMAFVKEWRQS